MRVSSRCGAAPSRSVRGFAQFEALGLGLGEQLAAIPGRREAQSSACRCFCSSADPATTTPSLAAVAKQVPAFSYWAQARLASSYIGRAG